MAPFWVSLKKKNEEKNIVVFLKKNYVKERPLMCLFHLCFHLHLHFFSFFVYIKVKVQGF